MPAPAALSPTKDSPVHIEYDVRWTLQPSGRYGEKMYVLRLPGCEPWIIQSVV
jgi:hypothetical protein